jgi:hypothetical protein
VWADIDNDGYRTCSSAARPPSQLFRNQGTTSRTSRGRRRGPHRLHQGVAAADYDRDGDVDFYL